MIHIPKSCADTWQVSRNVPQRPDYYTFSLIQPKLEPAKQSQYERCVNVNTQVFNYLVGTILVSKVNQQESRDRRRKKSQQKNGGLDIFRVYN